jgi:hypothetical protein
MYFYVTPWLLGLLKGHREKARKITQRDGSNRPFGDPGAYVVSPSVSHLVKLHLGTHISLYCLLSSKRNRKASIGSTHALSMVLVLLHTHTANCMSGGNNIQSGRAILRKYRVLVKVFMTIQSCNC